MRIMKASPRRRQAALLGTPKMMRLDFIPAPVAGCPTSRSFFARCGIPPRSPRIPHNNADLFLRRPGISARTHLLGETQVSKGTRRSVHTLEGKTCGIPHLAKNERDV